MFAIFVSVWNHNCILKEWTEYGSWTYSLCMRFELFIALRVRTMIFRVEDIYINSWEEPLTSISSGLKWVGLKCGWVIQEVCGVDRLTITRRSASLCQLGGGGSFFLSILFRDAGTQCAVYKRRVHVWRYIHFLV